MRAITLRSLVALALLAATAPAFVPPAAAASGPEDSVVGLVVTYQSWDEDRPWAKTKPETRIANGTIVPGPYILTTAQLVADATFIQPMKSGRQIQAIARVVHVDPEINLALLTVEPADFFDDLRPVALAARTPTRGVLRTVRWKGQQFESLASRVKRFEVETSYFGWLEHVFLHAQTDISGGGWAETVLDDEGRLVGVTVSQQDQVVRIIPVEILSRFLEKVARPGPYREFAVFGARWQVNEDPALADYLGQRGEPTGVLIRQVPWGSSACGVLRPRDILLSVAGNAIDAQGFYDHPRLGRIRFTHLFIDGHDTGDRVPIRVIRDGQTVELEMTLRGYPLPLTLMPARRAGEAPPYLVVGGLLLRELDGEYMRTWGNEWTDRAPLHLLTRYFRDREAQRPDRRRVVILTSVLPAPYNVGYQDLRDFVVDEVNGRPVDSIEAILEALGRPDRGRFHVLGLEPNVVRQEIVLDAEGLEAATRQVLQDYGIPEASRMREAPLPDGGPDCPGTF